MLKEIVNFSKKLEESGIYEEIKKENQKIDKPIFVIPVNDDLTELEIEKSYFVFKNITEKDTKIILHLDGKRNKDNAGYKSKEVKLEHNNDELKSSLRKVDNESKQFKQILLNIDNYSQKPSNDQKGNKSIGSNKGTNSYTTLIFTLKNTTHLKDKDTFFSKIKNTYTQNFLKGFPDDLSDESQSDYKKILNQLSRDEILEKFWSQLQFLKENTIVKNKESFKEIHCIIKFSDDLIKQENIYDTWYNKYLSKKLFKTDPPTDAGYPKLHCSICNEFSDTWLPNAFHNLDSKKPYTLHLDRKKSHNLAVCSKCSFELYKFQELFLNKKKITVFPLFIDDEFEQKEILLLKNDLTKISFSEVVKEVVKESSMNIFDFYLILYNRDMGFLNFDYISGFEFFKNGKSVFEIEHLINELFYDEKLTNNYFSAKIDSGNSNLDNLMYRFRIQIFDFVYRAKENIRVDEISQMYIETLFRKFLECHNKKKEYSARTHIDSITSNFMQLNKTLGGNLMQTVERIKESGKVTDLESFAFYLGQVVKILLKKSKKDSKNHSLVEPFINVTNFKVMSMKLQETFNSYKHSIYLNDASFNQKMSEIFSFFYDNQDKEFTRDLKILFYAGYFDENIIYENKK